MTGPNGAESENEAAAFPALRFDPQEYMQFVEDEDVTEAQAEELLGTIWLIVVAFVDLGFNIHPVQQVLDKSGENVASDSPEVVSSRDEFSNSIKQAAATRPNGHAAELEES
ncbi:MAG: hypothetical protein H6873_01205 [Hyphomicrobiaceae bacterium]|nr:hypothetical protein [Hyphomicrobiaceae bacterium]